MKWLLALGSLLLVAGCGEKGTASSGTGREAPDKPTVCEDLPMDAYRRDLLAMAFDGISAMPLNPHIKNRSRGQIQVLQAALTLEQPQLAESWLPRIANWQRWMGYAELAGFYAEHDRPQQAEKALNQARIALEMVEKLRSGAVLAAAPNPLIDTLTDWRYQNVKSTVDEVGQLLAAAQPVPSYEDAMAELRRVAASEDFEVVHAAQCEMVTQAGLAYDTLNLQEWTAAEIESGFLKMPVFLKLDILEQLALVCIGQDDPDQALWLADRADAMISTAALPPRLLIPEQVKFMRVRMDAGDEETALLQLDELMALYLEKHDFIVDIERAALLCRLAEGYRQSGNTARALELYSLAADEGLVNPNSRPRADDLSAICRSMALQGVEPDDALSEKLRNINDQLGDPW